MYLKPADYRWQLIMRPDKIISSHLPSIYLIYIEKLLVLVGGPSENTERDIYIERERGSRVICVVTLNPS